MLMLLFQCVAAADECVAGFIVIIWGVVTAVLMCIFYLFGMCCCCWGFKEAFVGSPLNNTSIGSPTGSPRDYPLLVVFLQSVFMEIYWSCAACNKCGYMFFLCGPSFEFYPDFKFWYWCWFECTGIPPCGKCGCMKKQEEKKTNPNPDIKPKPETNQNQKQNLILNQNPNPDIKQKQEEKNQTNSYENITKNVDDDNTNISPRLESTNDGDVSKTDELPENRQAKTGEKNQGTKKKHTEEVDTQNNKNVSPPHDQEVSKTAANDVSYQKSDDSISTGNSNTTNDTNYAYPIAFMFIVSFLGYIYVRFCKSSNNTNTSHKKTSRRKKSSSSKTSSKFSTDRNSRTLFEEEFDELCQLIDSDNTGRITRLQFERFFPDKIQVWPLKGTDDEKSIDINQLVNLLYSSGNRYVNVDLVCQSIKQVKKISNYLKQSGLIPEPAITPKMISIVDPEIISSTAAAAPEPAMTSITTVPATLPSTTAMTESTTPAPPTTYTTTLSSPITAETQENTQHTTITKRQSVSTSKTDINENDDRSYVAEETTIKTEQEN